mmetsp:Transcript_39328/g.60098  ORF Transcript_39328/g.60098 Transcript_39328/m.60098 type:complete len:159 (+) Transcript_39328:471-947(+)
MLEEQRKQTYKQMLQKQKGFLFTIFASSVILSALLIAAFVAFVFKLGFFQHNSQSFGAKVTVEGSKTLKDTLPVSPQLSLESLKQVLGSDILYLKQLGLFISDSLGWQKKEDLVQPFQSYLSTVEWARKKRSDDRLRYDVFTADEEEDDEVTTLVMKA